MLKIIIMILNLTVTSYEYSNPVELVEMIGHATNEVLCKESDDKLNSASCAAYCHAQSYWLSKNDVVEDMYQCLYIMDWKVLENEDVI